MSSLAARYIRSQAQNEESSALALLLRRQADDPDLSTEEKDQLELALTKTQHSAKSLVSTYREKLKKTHLEFKDPRQTYAEAIEAYEVSKVAYRAAMKARIAQGGEEAARARDELLMGEASLHEPTVEEEGAYYAFDPATGSKAKEPLAYPHEIEWAHFSKYVKRNPFSKTVDLHRTLMEFMTVGKKKGLTRKKLMELIKLLLFHERPENYTSVSMCEDPYRVFEVTLGLIDYTTHLAKLRVALKKVARRPEESVNTAVWQYASIVQELLQVQTPDSTEQQNEDLANKEAARAIKNFVTPEMWHEVCLFKKMYIQQNGNEACPLQELFDFINDSEDTEPKMRPKTTLTMSANIQVDLFLTEQSRHHTWQLGDTNPSVDTDDGDDEEEEEDGEVCFATEAETPYSNWPPGAGHGVASANYENWPPHLGGYPGSGASAAGGHTSSPTQTVNMASASRGPQVKTSHTMTTRTKGPASHTKEDLPPQRRKKTSVARPQKAKGLSVSASHGGGRSAATKPNQTVGDRPRERSLTPGGGVRAYSPPTHNHRPGGRGRSPPRPVSPGRTLPAYSPNTGRRRYYTTSPGGRAYPVPRDNLFTVDKGSNQLRPKSRTPSRDRGQGAKDKCQVCDKKLKAGNPHHCDYGKIKATDRSCSKCRRGRHPSSVCLGPPKSRSPSRDGPRDGSRGRKGLPRFNPALNL